MARTDKRVESILREVSIAYCRLVGGNKILLLVLSSPPFSSSMGSIFVSRKPSRPCVAGTQGCFCPPAQRAKDEPARSKHGIFPLLAKTGSLYCFTLLLTQRSTPTTQGRGASWREMRAGEYARRGRRRAPPYVVRGGRHTRPPAKIPSKKAPRRADRRGAIGALQSGIPISLRSTRYG